MSSNRKKIKKNKMPTLTISQYLDAVLPGKYIEKRIAVIKRWQKLIHVQMLTINRKKKC
jgi:hypothetical protein